MLISLPIRRKQDEHEYRLRARLSQSPTEQLLTRLSDQLKADSPGNNLSETELGLDGSGSGLDQNSIGFPADQSEWASTRTELEVRYAELQTKLSKVSSLKSGLEASKV